MESPGNLISVHDIRGALDEELDAASSLLPASAIAPALQSRRDEVAEWAYKQVAGTFVPSPHEIVAVNKERHGVRPVAVWDLVSRLLYGALTARLTPSLSRPSRRSRTWRGFKRQPLRKPGRYVVAADIASCYEFIDHALLAQELLVQGGNYQIVSTLIELLRETSGRSYGLPQQSASSDVLAEVFLDKLERALVRRGLTIGRYNDDFRINCDSWSNVVRSIEILSEEARRSGLILNDSKMFTWSKAAYRRHLDETESLRAQIASEAELDLESFDVDEYGGIDGWVGNDIEDIESLTSIRILERWEHVGGRGRVPESDRAVHRALLQLLPLAFAGLGAAGEYDPRAISIAMQMLRYEQTMTPYVARYLLACDDGYSVLWAFDNLLDQDAYLTGWQTWWLQQPLARFADFASGTDGLRRAQWVRDAFTSAERSPVLRAQAAMTLARHNLTDAEELLGVYNRSSPVTRPVVVSAMGLLKPSKEIRRARTGDSQLDRWIFDWANRNA